MARDDKVLPKLLEEYERAPQIYRATRYWSSYQARIFKEIRNLDFGEIESGKYPWLSTFGFGGAPYLRPPGRPSLRPRNLLRNTTRQLAATLLDRGQSWFLPHRLNLDDIYKLAFNRCELLAIKSGAKTPTEINASNFGNPQDGFSVGGNFYTLRFLDYYCRYCFASSVIPFSNPRQIFVEIGSGSGKQIEVLKKILPEAIFLCFDLPIQVYLGHGYLSGVFGEDVVPLAETYKWDSLRNLEQGNIYMFGNWQVPLIRDLEFDVFWNAASFGEMEPDVVQNYLGLVRAHAKWVYLMQARSGKMTGLRRGGVETPQDFAAYCSYLPEYELVKEQESQTALHPLRESGGYFEAVWHRA